MDYQLARETYCVDPKDVKRDIDVLLWSMKLYSRLRYFHQRYWEKEALEAVHAQRTEGFPRLENVAEHSWHVADSALLLGGHFPTLDLSRTAALGGHVEYVEQCDTCGHRVISYNSWRNRHCPKCQAMTCAKWLAEREGELLPVLYFHVVFTLPRQIGGLALQNAREIYRILFRAASETSLTIAADPKRLGAAIGFLAVRRSGRRHQSRRHALDRMQEKIVLPSRGSIEQPLQKPVQPATGNHFQARLP